MSSSPRRCTQCGETKPASDFYFDKRNVSSGLTARCKVCHNAAVKERWDAKSDAEKKAIKAGRPSSDRAHRKSYELKVKYGITLDDWNAMLESQGGVCASCKQPPSASGFDVDHCHDTGRVRGLLCHGCNVALGLLREDPVRVQMLANYIKDVCYV